MKPIFGFVVSMCVAATGCQQEKPAAPAGGGMQGMPVRTESVTLAPVAAGERVRGDDQVAAIGDPAAAGEGTLTQIRVKSGDHVKAGPGADGDRPAAAGGDGGVAAGHGAAEEGALRLQHGGGGAAAQAV